MTDLAKKRKTESKHFDFLIRMDGWQSDDAETYFIVREIYIKFKMKLLKTDL